MPKGGTKPQELSVSIRTYRKKSNGTTAANRPQDEGRNGKTGKVAIVRNKAGEEIGRFTQPNFKALSKQLRGKYNISPSVAIAKSGETTIWTR